MVQNDNRNAQVAQVNKVLTLIDKESISPQVAMAVSLALRLRSLQADHAVEIAVRIPSIISMQTAALTMDEAMHALVTLIDQEGDEILTLPDETLTARVVETAILSMYQIIAEYEEAN